jgi:hypothetical protein
MLRDIQASPFFACIKLNHFGEPNAVLAEKRSCGNSGEGPSLTAIFYKYSRAESLGDFSPAGYQEGSRVQRVGGTP